MHVVPAGQQPNPPQQACGQGTPVASSQQSAQLPLQQTWPATVQSALLQQAWHIPLQQRPEGQHMPSQGTWALLQQAAPLTPEVHCSPAAQQLPDPSSQQCWPDGQQPGGLVQQLLSLPQQLPCAPGHGVGSVSQPLPQQVWSWRVSQQPDGSGGQHSCTNAVQQWPLPQSCCVVLEAHAPLQQISGAGPFGGLGSQQLPPQQMVVHTPPALSQHSAHCPEPQQR